MSLPLSLALALGCGQDPESGAPSGSAQAASSQPSAAPQHDSSTTVVAAAIAALEPEAAAERLARSPQAPEVDTTDLEQRVDGLLETIASKDEGPLRRAALLELKGLGNAAIPHLGACLDAYPVDGRKHQGAAEALSEIGTYESVEALLERVERRPGPGDPNQKQWARQHCAWRIGFTDHDWTVPRLLVCLAREQHHEVLLWIARTLSKFDNLAGLETCRWLKDNGVHVGVQREAVDRLREMQTDFGLKVTSDLVAVWRGEVPEGMPERTLVPSKNLQLEVWRRIRDLAEWQLRPVDDARTVLANMNAWAAEPLARALEDANPYVRTHAAQALERMGPRGRAAGPALLALLEREPAQAPQAAAALGAIEHKPAAEALERRLGPETELELRVACARALGRLGADVSSDLFEPLFEESEPLELRAVAAEALVRTAPSLEVAAPLEFLLAQLSDPEVDPIGPEAALGDWILRRGREGSPDARALWVQWRELERLQLAPGEPEKEQQRLAQRRDLLRAALPGILDGSKDLKEVAPPPGG